MPPYSCWQQTVCAVRHISITMTFALIMILTTLQTTTWAKDSEKALKIALEHKHMYNQMRFHPNALVPTDVSFGLIASAGQTSTRSHSTSEPAVDNFKTKNIAKKKSIIYNPFILPKITLNDLKPDLFNLSIDATTETTDFNSKYNPIDNIKSKDIAIESSPPVEDEDKDQEAYDIIKCVAKALKDNPQVASARAKQAAAESFCRATYGPFLPSVTTGYNYTQLSSHNPNQSNQLSQASTQYQLYFKVHETIFAGFKDLNNFFKGRLLSKQADYNVDNTELSLILAVQQAFLNLLAGRENVRSISSAIARLDSQLKVTRAFYEVGMKPRFDVLQAETDKASAENKLLQAHNVVATSKANLNILLNLPINANINYIGKLEYNPFSMEIEECLDRAYKKRPDIAIAHKSVEIAKKDADMARSELFPQISTSWQWQQNSHNKNLQGNSRHTNGPFDVWQAQVGASWLVFDWGTTFYNWQQAKNIIRQLEVDEQKLHQQVGLEIKIGLLDIKEATKRIKVNKAGVDSAREGYRMSVARYQAQVGTITQMLDAQSRLSLANFNLIQAMVDYKSAIAKLYIAMGERNMSLLTQ
ncbi:outer membrane protein [Desulfovibrionales bacterium]